MASQSEGFSKGNGAMLVDKQSGELFLYQPIGVDWFGEGITGSTVIQALDVIGSKRAIVRINSPGGDAFEGIAIYNALKRHAAGVDVIVDALAASAASIIALAGETRTTAKGAMWMVHRASTFAFGNAEEVQKALNMLNAGDKSLAAIYATAMSKTEAEIMDIMTAETWYTEAEALAAGLSTQTEGAMKEKPAVAAWFKNAPKAMYNTTSVVVPKYRYVPAMR